jgi:hypothetical protein
MRIFLQGCEALRPERVGSFFGRVHEKERRICSRVRGCESMAGFNFTGGGSTGKALVLETSGDASPNAGSIPVHPTNF